MSDFSKKYDPALIEHEVAMLREKKKISCSSKEEQTLVSLPLPTSASLHLGHAENVSLQDAIARHAHLLGKKTTFLPARYYGSFLTNEKIQVLLKKLGVSKDKLSTGQFFDILSKHIKKQKKSTITQLQKFGISMQFDKEESTFSIAFSRFLRKLFYDLVQNDTIYEAEDIVYRNTKYQTSLGKDEVRFEKKIGKKYTIKYFISTKNNSVNIMTTTPETIFGDVALAVHPQNKKYHALVGQHAIIPIINRTIPIIADERVDMFANNGIIRITPAHDLFSLQIAKDHQLPVDHFAIDQNGCFTEYSGNFAGKKVDEFIDNILQNLYDIDNMVREDDCEYDFPICKKTGEKLQTMCLVQWFLTTSQAQEKLQHAINDGLVKIYPGNHMAQLKEQIATISHRCISKNYLLGQSLPIWISDKKSMIYVLDESDVLESYKKDKNKQKFKVILSIVIFNLIADGRINISFEMDELINILLSQDLDSDRTILETYLDIFDEELSIYKPQVKELRELSAYASQKSKSETIEKFASSFLKILDNSFALEHVANHKYKFLIDALVQRDSGLKQERTKFDISFVNSMLLLFELGLFKDHKTKASPRHTTITAGESVLLEIGKVLLLGLQLTDSLPCDTIFVNKMVCDHKQKKMGSLCQNNVDLNGLIKEFGADVVRLYLLTNTADPLVFVPTQLPVYSEFLHKFWNACRYVSLKTDALYGKKKITPDALEKDLSKHILDLQDFDLWIINKIKILFQEVDNYISINSIGEFGNKLFLLIKNDFCDKYLEISKNSKSPLTDKVMILAVSKILKLLWIYAPFISEKIWILMGFQDQVSDQKLTGDFLEAINKNYKIQLFMDIIDKLLSIKEQLGCKKHIPVDAFIKANPDFLRFTKSNEATIKRIVNISKIEYMDTNENNLPDYTTEDVIDMTIGLKISRIQHIEDKPKGLTDLQKELTQFEEYLQYLKNTVSHMIANHSDEIQIASKKKEIAHIKKSMLELEYEIGKMKTK